MNRALLTAASGMKAMQHNVDTIANNIANVNTTGFKKSQLSFRSLLYQTFREPGQPTSVNQMNPSGFQIGSGTEIAGTFKSFSQGVLEPTGNTYDLGIEGEGFFRITLPNGESRYSRDGSFRVDGLGQLVTPQGYLVDTAPNIPSDALSITIGEDGTVASFTGSSAPPSNVGTIGIFRFPNPAGLRAEGGNFYSETGSSGTSSQVTPAQNGAGLIRQGSLERSNVAIVDELVGLILAQRNYEVNSRAIRVSDEMMQELGQIVR